MQDHLIESGVIGSSAIDGVLSGKHYNRALRAHKLLFEAMMRLKWQEFEGMLNPEQDPSTHQRLHLVHCSLEAVR